MDKKLITIVYIFSYIDSLRNVWFILGDDREMIKLEFFSTKDQNGDILYRRINDFLKVKVKDI